MATDSLTSSATSVSNKDSSLVGLGVIKGNQKKGQHNPENPGIEGQPNQDSTTTLECELTQSSLSKVKADEGNKGANSGDAAYQDLKRGKFVISSQEIDHNFISQLYEEHVDLIKNDKGKKNYRLFAKKVFTEMFNYAKAGVPDDHILEELITNCNQAGYDGSLLLQLFPIFFKYNLQLPDANDRRIEIVCNNQGFLSIKYCPSMPVKQQGTNKEICRLDAILEFALKSQNGKVEYENGKVTLIIPEQLKHYQANGESLLGDIEKYFTDADNAVVESLEANMGEGPRSFVVDQKGLNSDEGLSFVMIPKNSTVSLDNIAELVKGALDNKDVNALSTYVDVVKAGVVPVSPQEGLSIVGEIKEMVNKFTTEQGKAWNTYPTMPLISEAYAITEWLQGYISYEDWNKVKLLEKILYKIKSDLIKISSNNPNEGSPVINVTGQPIAPVATKTASSQQEEENVLVGEGADWSVKDKDGKTALDLGSKEKSSDESEITKFLKDLDGKTPLHHAVENNNFGTAERLLKKGVDVNARDTNDWTPLGLAIRDGKLKVVKLLLDHSADVSIETRNNHTHLSWAIQRNEAHEKGDTWKIIELLFEKKAKVGEKELKEAIRVGNPKVIELLVNKGAVITQEIVQYGNKAFKDCEKGRAHISKYPGGLEGEKQTRAKISGFLEGNVQLNSELVANEPATSSQVVDGVGDDQSENPEPKTSSSQQVEENVLAGEGKSNNIIGNMRVLAEDSLGENCTGGKMDNGDKNIESIEKRLSDAIWDINFEEVKRLVEQGGDYITQLILSKALEEARQTEVGKKNIASKGKLIKIREFLEAKLKSISASTTELPVGGSVESIGATTSGQEIPVQPAESKSQDVQPNSPLPSPPLSPKSFVGSESSGSSSSFIKLPEEDKFFDAPGELRSEDGQQNLLPPSSLSLASNSGGSDSPFSLVGTPSDTDSNNGCVAEKDPTLIDSGSLQGTQPKTLATGSGSGNTGVEDDQNPPPAPKPIPPPEPEPLVTQDKDDSKKPINPGKNNHAPQNAKSSELSVITASALAIAGVALGVVIAVHLEMLTVGIAVGVCCLVAAVMYYCNGPSSSLENTNTKLPTNEKAYCMTVS